MTRVLMVQVASEKQFGVLRVMHSSPARASVSL